MFGIPKQGRMRIQHRARTRSCRRFVRAWPVQSARRIASNLPILKNQFLDLLQKPACEGGYGKTNEEIGSPVLHAHRNTRCGSRRRSAGGGEQRPRRVPVAAGGDGNADEHERLDRNRNGQQPSDARSAGGSDPEEFPHAEVDLGHGDVLIAAITSCTNTSNPSVMLAAGLLAKKAVERGLTVRSSVKNSLAPGSRVVTEYLQKTGLQPYLDQLGFNLVGYGCTTCIGNSGPLDPTIEAGRHRPRFDRGQRAFRQSKF